jgi:hypothetical protein
MRRLIEWWKSLFAQDPDVVASTGIRMQGEIVSDQEHRKLMNQYNRRIAHCGVQILKWTTRIKSGIYDSEELPYMREQIKSIKATRKHFENLIKQDKRK